MDWQILTADCREAMRTREPGSARLVFADPPYNQRMPYGPHCPDDLTPADYLAGARAWLREAGRLLGSDGSLWLLVSHEWAWQLIPLALSAGFHLRQTITWYETFGVNCKGKFNRCSRPLLWFVRDPRRFVFHDCPEIRRPSDRQAKYRDKRADPRGKFWDDVWMIPRVAGTHRERIRGFPTQLPIRLLRPIVACASDPGDLVVDPFCGSGTTGAACLELGRRFLGIELSPGFVELASKRLRGIESAQTASTEGAA